MNEFIEPHLNPLQRRGLSKKHFKPSPLEKVAEGRMRLLFAYPEFTLIKNDGELRLPLCLGF